MSIVLARGIQGQPGTDGAPRQRAHRGLERGLDRGEWIDQKRGRSRMGGLFDIALGGWRGRQEAVINRTGSLGAKVVCLQRERGVRRLVRDA